MPGVTHTDELRQLSIEESKFLGGDVEHTHLVKGLDFALLRKTRAEIAETRKDAEFVAARKDEPQPREGKTSLANRKETRDVRDVRDVRSRTAVGRAVIDAAKSESSEALAKKQGETRNRIDERFASGRVAFAFALDKNAPDAPVTTVRSASEADAERTVCLLYTSPSPRDGLLSRMPSSA